MLASTRRWSTEKNGSSTRSRPAAARMFTLLAAKPQSMARHLPPAMRSGRPASGASRSTTAAGRRCCFSIWPDVKRLLYGAAKGYIGPLPRSRSSAAEVTRCLINPDRENAIMTTIKKFGPLVARILLAVIFIISGLGKIMGFQGTAGYIQSAGLPAPQLLTVIAIIVELGGGILLVIGWKARWAAAA